MTLADHQTGAPFVLLNVHDACGAIAATPDLLQRSDIPGQGIPVDARHTPRKTAAIITPTADTVFTVKGNAPETFDILATIDWETEATGPFTEDWAKDHGRLEQRSIAVLTPPVDRITDPGLRPVARITRDREPLKADPKRAEKEQETDPPTDTETATIRTAPDADTAAPEDRLQTNRGHWNGEGVWTIATRAPGIRSLIRSLPKTPAHRFPDRSPLPAKPNHRPPDRGEKPLDHHASVTDTAT